MAPRIQWSVELVTDVTIVPRLEDHLIDDLFYQEDEIGEMRHTAFMIECGLEEDPPDGPDVPPVPWGDMLLKQQQSNKEKQNTANKSAVNNNDKNNTHNDNKDDRNSTSREKRELPTRSRSTDDIDTLAIELTSNQKGPQKSHSPKRANSTALDLFVVDGKFSPASPTKRNVTTRRNSSAEARSPRSPEKHSLNKSHSDDDIREMGLSVSLAKTEGTQRSPGRIRRKTPENRKLTKTRSGTPHEMAVAAARARKKLSSDKGDENKAPASRRLTKTRSGTPHEMATAAARARKKLDAQKSKKNSENVIQPSYPSVRERRNSIESSVCNSPIKSAARRRNSIESIACKKPEEGARSAPLVRSLVASKSGTLHGMRNNTQSKDESGTSDDTEQNQNETLKIVYKNGKRMSVRSGSSLSKASRSKPKSNSSDHDKKSETVVYRNGKKEIIKRSSSASCDGLASDEDFLGDIISDSDNESVRTGDISIDTCGSDIAESRSSSRKGQKSVISRTIELAPSPPVRKMSLTKREISDDNSLDRIKPTSSRSTEKDSTKKKKKKKKKNDGDSKDILPDSISSIKKKKKKKEKKEISDDDTADSIYDSFSSPSPRKSEQKKTQNEFLFGDLQPGCYPSPSSIRSQHRKRLSKKSSPIEPQKDDCQTTSVIKIERQQRRTSGSEEFLYSPTKSARDHNRPDDWIGSGKPQKRTWRVKSKNEGK